MRRRDSQPARTDESLSRRSRGGGGPTVQPQATSTTRVASSLWTRRGRRRWLRRQLSLLQVALAIDVALTVGDPARRRFALQVVIEPLEDAVVIIDLVLALA